MRRSQELLTLLERREQYLELLSVTTGPGLLLHIVDAIDHADAALDELDPERQIPRRDLVAVPKG